MMRRAKIIVVFFVALAGLAQARTITVGPGAGYDFNSIQPAIDDSNDGDTIIVQPGLYPESVQFHGKNITLTSTNPDDWNVVASTSIKSVWFVGTEDPNCTLTGFKIYQRIGGGMNHTHATISHCLLSDNRVSDGTVIRGCDGTISNCMIVDNRPSGDVFASAIRECHGLIKNCTVAHNVLGVRVGKGGTTTIENCIIYHNRSGQIGVAGTLNIAYSNVDGGLHAIYGGGTVNWGPGNMDTDPCFVRVGGWYRELEGDYHLKSQAGRWDPNSESWVQDDVTSPCIDAGNPMSPIGNEPFPNGGRVNIGAYGGTPEASKSYFGQPVCETIVAGDINGDCKVNFKDFALMALHWLKAEPYLLNRPPMVNITNPENSAVFYTNETIEVEADASDTDGIVVKVEFFANENKIGEDNDGTDGWRTNWRGHHHPPGTYSLTAKATDNDRATTISPAVEITVKSGGGPPP